MTIVINMAWAIIILVSAGVRGGTAACVPGRYVARSIQCVDQ